jgi:DNA-directed RNA polymerase subunit M/transcription elongation factor TFIIS
MQCQRCKGMVVLESEPDENYQMYTVLRCINCGERTDVRVQQNRINEKVSRGKWK